jgi:hypothetical protein
MKSLGHADLVFYADHPQHWLLSENADTKNGDT